MVPFAPMSLRKRSLLPSTSRFLQIREVPFAFQSKTKVFSLSDMTYTAFKLATARTLSCHVLLLGSIEVGSDPTSVVIFLGDSSPSTDPDICTKTGHALEAHDGGRWLVSCGVASRYSSALTVHARRPRTERWRNATEGGEVSAR